MSPLGGNKFLPNSPLVPKAKLGHLKRVHHGILYSGKYLTPSNVYIGFPYHLMVRPKRHGTACAIGPKGEARTHGTACAISPKGEARTHRLLAPLVPKVWLGHLNWVRHRVLIFRKLYTWVGFNYPPWLGPKDTEPRAPSVPKAMLGHTDRVRHWSQRRS